MFNRNLESYRFKGDMTTKPDFDRVAASAFHAPLNSDGVAVLPAEWDGWDEVRGTMHTGVSRP